MSTLSYSRWIFLLSFAALTLISASEGSSFVGLTCWELCIFPRKQHLQSCFEQIPRHGCRTHGFVVESKNGRKFCVQGNTQWIQTMISEGHLHCPPDISR